MNIWFAIYFGLTLMGLGLYLSKHGKRKEGTYNFFSMTAAQAFVWWILYMAGAFDGLIQ